MSKVELVLRGGPSDGVVITVIEGAVPGFVGYRLTGEKDEQGRYVLKHVGPKT